MTAEKKTIIIKSIVIFALIVLVTSAETSLFPYIEIYGVVPSVLIYIVTAAAVFEGPSAGLICGAAAGFFADGAYGLSFCYYTIFMVFAGAFVGNVSPNFFRKRVPTAMGWGTLFWFFCEFLRFFFSIYLFGKSDLTPVITVIFPGLLYSLAVSPAVIFPISHMYRKMKKEPGLFR
jgi:rod shape-determining protein MreD